MKLRLKKPDSHLKPLLNSALTILKTDQRVWAMLALLILLGLFLVFRSSPDALYLAMVGPLSGERKADGDEMVRRIELLVQQVNQEGGINGKKVKLLRFDDQNDSKLASQRAADIAKSQNVLQDFVLLKTCWTMPYIML